MTFHAEAVRLSGLLQQASLGQVEVTDTEELERLRVEYAARKQQVSIR